jgi:hypothetical protein
VERARVEDVHVQGGHSRMRRGRTGRLRLRFVRNRCGCWNKVAVCQRYDQVNFTIQGAVSCLKQKVS